jgi:hypothetical protein
MRNLIANDRSWKGDRLAESVLKRLLARYGLDIIIALNSLARCWGAPIHEGLANFLIREPRGRDHEPGFLLT